ncbi:MAG: dihydrodipicolinate synthase family protein [Bryobacteraceae bacterium]
MVDTLTIPQVLGSVPVIPAPFDEAEQLDEAALRRLVDHAVRARLRAICLPAYGSEFYKLTEDERLRMVAVAVEQANGRVRVFAQSNHGSARIAADLARRNVRAGAGQISVAIPRQFAVPREQLLRYLTTVLEAAEVPCLVQDFNPGGPTVDAEFVAELKRRCPNFLYLKLEEPLMSTKIRAIREATEDGVGILEGWGGMYMLELIPAGIYGLMPGLALAEPLDHVFHWRADGRNQEAFDLFQKILPQIVFCLQSMELFHYCEKRLLQAMGLMKNAVIRTPAYVPDPDTARFVDELNHHLLQSIAEFSGGSF